MKKIKLLALLFIASISSITELQAQSKNINTSTSFVGWVGKKVTGAHTGTLKFTSGTLTFNGKTLTGGTFTVDMTSLEVTDLKAGEGKEKLEGHLKSDDFFGVNNHKTATLKFKAIDELHPNHYKITADLTIKGVSHPVVFELAVTDERVRTSFKVDRTKYGIKYGSGSFFDNLGDKAIYDEFDIDVALYF